jgi:hypothetical protein
MTAKSLGGAPAPKEPSGDPRSQKPRQNSTVTVCLKLKSWEGVSVDGRTINFSPNIASE